LPTEFITIITFINAQSVSNKTDELEIEIVLRINRMQSLVIVRQTRRRVLNQYHLIRERKYSSLKLFGKRKVAFSI